MNYFHNDESDIDTRITPLTILPSIRDIPPMTHFSMITLLTQQNSEYPYTHDLVMLDSFKSMNTNTPPIPNVQRIITPLNARSWQLALSTHPDSSLVAYLLSGINQGFRIGFDNNTRLESAHANMLSAEQNPKVVTEYLHKEQQARRIVGPLPMTNFVKVVHTSRFGVIPKKRQPGKWRLILDLSFPAEHSVNAGIDKRLSSLQYTSVDDAAKIISELGPQAHLAKIDIAHAYRNIPVHPTDRHLLGMQWSNQLFVDTVLPFGLRSAPKIFCAVSDALEWILFKRGISSCLHYIDDFITFGRANSSQCEQNLHLITTTCEELGVPLQVEKIEGPACVMTFLGIEFDTENMIMRLPDDKRCHLQQLLDNWLKTKRAARKREVLSLIGELAHACKVVSPGRIFLRRIIDCSTSRPALDDWIRISTEFKSDLMWWSIFLNSWNGISMLQSHLDRKPDIHVFTDASGGWGCGATWNRDWFKAPWSKAWLNVNIATKELVPIILAVAIWGDQWLAKHVQFHSDNTAVVAVIKSKSSRDPSIMHLLRCLHFFSARYDITVSAVHVPGVCNSMADALSRDDCKKFFLLSPKSKQVPSTVTKALWTVVVESQPDWLSPNWRLKLGNI